MGPVGSDRLRDGRDIAAVLRGRRKRAGALLVAHVRDREDELPARLAVVASRRVGGAVERNRAKRLLRAASASLSWTPGHDIVLVARAACVESGMAAVRDELIDCTRVLGVADVEEVIDLVSDPAHVTVGVEGSS